jgi:hypothetical protein
LKFSSKSWDFFPSPLSFLKTYFLASLKTHSAYYKASGYINRIKRKKENCRQLNESFCPRNGSEDRMCLFSKTLSCSYPSYHLFPSLGVMDVEHSLFWNFPSLFNILSSYLPNSLQQTPDQEGSVSNPLPPEGVSLWKAYGYFPHKRY